MTDFRVAEAATQWYAKNARDLPWRHPDTTPWAVLISEVMLQQTPVSRVEPVWQAWCARWPTPTALAAESCGEAIRAWGRLGYPRRALRLHGCATAIVARHGGTVPHDLSDLLALPGIGTYTARAVAAFAFRQRHPVVDTNVRRVIARATTGKEAVGSAATVGDLTAVERLLPLEAEAAAVASAAFMELGALVCTARAPRCPECPLVTTCALQTADTATGSEAPGDRVEPNGSRGRGSRTQRYIGTDRYVRGLLLAILRDHTGPVPAGRLDAVWPDQEQRSRALGGLLADGLACEVTTGHYALPG